MIPLLPAKFISEYQKNSNMHRISKINYENLKVDITAAMKTKLLEAQILSPNINILDIQTRNNPMLHRFVAIRHFNR